MREIRMSGLMRGEATQIPLLLYRLRVRIFWRKKIMTTNYDPHKYANLSGRVSAGVIQTEDENEKAIEVAGRLMKKGEGRRSPEEERLLSLSVTLIEDFEEKAYPMGQSSNPAVALRELMSEHELKQTDVLDIFGSQGVVSQVLNGKREGSARPRLENLRSDSVCLLISLFKLGRRPPPFRKSISAPTSTSPNSPSPNTNTKPTARVLSDGDDQSESGAVATGFFNCLTPALHVKDQMMTNKVWDCRVAICFLMTGCLMRTAGETRELFQFCV